MKYSKSSFKKKASSYGRGQKGSTRQSHVGRYVPVARGGIRL